MNIFRKRSTSDTDKNNNRHSGEAVAADGVQRDDNDQRYGTAATTSSVKELIKNNYTLLLRTIDPTDELLNQLAITWSAGSQVPLIEESKSPDAKCGTLLRILCDLPSTDEFVKALIDNGQEHAANIFTGSTGKVPMSEAHFSQLQNGQHRMRRFIDSTGELLDELIGSRVLTNNDVYRVRAASTSDGMATELIRVLQRKSDCAFDSFVNALMATGQHHVVYILTGQGDDRPLGDIYVQRLADKLNHLTRHLDLTNGLLGKLVKKRVLTRTEMERVMKTTGGMGQQCAFLLALMQRKSQAAFHKFVDALQATGQEHIVKKIAGFYVDGNIETYIALSCSEESKKRVEVDLVEAINAEGTVVGCHVLASSGSIRIRFVCFNNDEVDKLQWLHTSRRLNEEFCRLFLTGKSDSKIEYLELKIEEDAFSICRSELENARFKLMTSAHQRALCLAQGELADRITVSSTFLKHFDLCSMHMSAIIAGTSSGQQAKTLLEIVTRRPDAAFNHLINVLRATGQESEANEIAKLAVGNYTEDTVTSTVAGELGQLPYVSPTPKQFGIVEGEDNSESEETYFDGKQNKEKGADTRRTQTRVGRSVKRMSSRLSESGDSIISVDSGVQCPSISGDDTSSGLTLTHELVNGTPAVGLTSFDNHLFVLRECGNIEVYTTTTFEHEETFRLANLSKQTWCQIASCPTLKCIYVSDNTAQLIHRMKYGEHNEDTSWTVDPPTGLSVSSMHQLLVTCSTSPVKIQRFTTDGTRLNDIIIASINKRPSHAIRFLNGNVAVSFSHPARSLHQVCEVTTKGDVINSFNTHAVKRGSNDGPLNQSGQLVAVNRSGVIFVADVLDNKIVILDEMLSRVGNLTWPVAHEMSTGDSLTPGELDKPFALFYEDACDRLYVGERGGRVLVFDNLTDEIQRMAATSGSSSVKNKSRHRDVLRVAFQSNT